MSKSNPRKSSQQSPLVLGEGFPVNRSVCGCYLKKIVIKEKMWGEIPFHRIYLYFLHELSGKWITKYISDLPREAFDTNEQFNESKLNVARNLENLMACYLSGNHIKHIMFQTKVSGIVDKVSEIQEALLSKKFWDKEVCLKTIPNQDGGVSVARFAPYMNVPSGSSWTLSYSKWESDKVREWESKTLK